MAARRTIEIGDELTITYMDSALPVSERRAHLKRGYGFLCECALCRAQIGGGRPASVS